MAHIDECFKTDEEYKSDPYWKSGWMWSCKCGRSGNMTTAHDEAVKDAQYHLAHIRGGQHSARVDRS
jgi:acetoin utilization deacetylase AcuC-like enzyme